VVVISSGNYVRSVRRLFKKRNDFEGEPVEVTALREALKSKDTKITIQNKDGNTWTLYNDKLRGCFLAIGRVKVGDEKGQVMTRFLVSAIDGRVGSV
jgi:hypothetical protein